jgi:lipid-binding SYLF domain-containing protein
LTALGAALVAVLVAVLEWYDRPMNNLSRQVRRPAVPTLGACAASLVLLLSGCNSGTWNSTSPEATEAARAADRNALAASAQATIATFQATDPSFQRFLDQAHAYAVFPRVGQGGLIVGGGGGDGAVFQGGAQVGTARMSFGTVGAQIGGQTFSQVVLFQTQAAFDHFRNNNLEFAANASAVAVTAGGAATANWADGIAVFVQPLGGLMLDASIGGQKFTYRPL